MKRVASVSAATNSKRVKEESEEGQMSDGSCCRDDDESISSDPGQPLVVNLPVNILETVFAHLSVQDMMNCSLVCLRWSAICRREKFMFWKKRYTKLKRGRLKAWRRRREDANMECLMVTARFVQREFANTPLLDRGDEGRVSTLLTHHPQYTNVIGIIQRDRVLQKIEDSSLLAATVCLLVTLSRDVFEVRKVFLLLTAPGSPCCLMTVVDLFYCIAFNFYEDWREHVLPQRYHYKVCYVLTLFEQPSHTLAHREGVVSLTHEQSRIVNHPIKPGDVVKVVAFAGTGKTTTLLHFALAHPDHQFLYLVYNKSAQEQASKVFPKSNVECRTLHSLAFEYTGKRYCHKLNRSGSMYNKLPEFVVDGCNLKRPGRDKMTLYELNQLAYKTVENYLASADAEITREHTPDLPFDSYDRIPDYIIDGRLGLRKLLVEQAETIWEAMKDVDNKCPMTQDGCLKLFQLLQPRPRLDSGYDCILIDEAEDLSAAMVDILSQQTRPKIYVGDPHQQIYNLQGYFGDHAFHSIKPTDSYKLTKSFRFGPNIAFVVSVMLSELKLVHEKTLTGGLQDGGYYGEHESGQTAYIDRYRYNMIEGLLNTVLHSPDKKVALTAGTLDGFDFSHLEDVYYLHTNQTDKIKSAHIKQFKSIAELQSDVDTIEGIPLQKVIDICERNDVPKCIDLINNSGVLTRDISDADIVFSTAHSAKGCEFHTVHAGHDFLEEAYNGPTPEFDPDLCSEVELNLLYVTITRATHFVGLGFAGVDVLDEAKEYPVMHCMPSSVAKISDSCSNWDVCALDHGDPYPDEDIFVPLKTHFPIYKIPMNVTYEEEGPRCAHCVYVFYPELSPYFMD